MTNFAGTAAVNLLIRSAGIGKRDTNGTDNLALSLLESNPYHKTALATLNTDPHSGIAHYGVFCKTAREYNFISRTGRENFSLKLDSEKVKKLFTFLMLTKNSEETLPDFLKVHVRLLLAWFSAHYDQDLGSNTTFANKMLTEAKSKGESYKISSQLLFQLARLDLQTSPHRYTLQKRDFWHLTPDLKQINPQIVIFGPGDLFLRSVLPQIFALTEHKNRKKQSYLGEKTKIIIVGEKPESELIPSEGENAAGMTFKRYVLESCRNKGIKLPSDFEKIFDFIEYRPFPKAEEIESFSNLINENRNINETSLFFCCTPPQVYREVWSLMEPLIRENDLVYYEKPYGLNKSDTEGLNNMIQRSKRFSRVHVMDHYQGKEAFELVLDCRRQFLDQYLNSSFVESVELVCSENLNVKGRTFYDGVGAIKDMQSHMIGFFSLVAMDLPETEATNAESFSRQKFNFLKSVPEFQSSDLVLGQYQGYAQDVKKDASNTPTFFAATLKLENDRWEDVEFKFMHGKELDDKYSQVVINFKDGVSDPDCPKKVIFAIYPNPRVLLWFHDTPEDQPEIIKADENDVFSSRKDLTTEAYSKLILLALHGNPISIKPEEVQEQWRITDPITDPNLRPIEYIIRSTGPIPKNIFEGKPAKEFDRNLTDTYEEWFPV